MTGWPLDEEQSDLGIIYLLIIFLCSHGYYRP